MKILSAGILSGAISAKQYYLFSVRLWSLQTWTCIVSYKGHTFPVWDVRFSPHGYYFASGSHDRTARLWATDQPQPLRIFVGHYSDVEVTLLLSSTCRSFDFGVY